MSTKIVIIGDVGAVERRFHVGDEGMLEAALDALRARGDYAFSVVSALPAESAERYGVTAVPRLGFDEAVDDEERESRLAAVVAAAEGHAGQLKQDDPAWQVIEAVAGSDAVVVAGGGNLNSVWPEHVYERAALGRIAAAFSKPVLVSGQSLGPRLEGRHAELVGELLTGAVRVGVREEQSYTLARELGVAPQHLERTVDDAAFLDQPEPDELPASVGAEPYVLVTLAPYFGAADPDLTVPMVAGLLDAVSEVTGHRLVLLPHEGSLDGDLTVGDAALHARVAGHLRSPVLQLPVLSARASAALVRGAALSLSTRYHPAVFALGAGVPAVALHVDPYTEMKLRGTFANFGQAEAALPLLGVVTGDVREAIAELWQLRDAARGHATAAAESRRQLHADWWDTVHALVRGEQPPPYAWADPDPAALRLDAGVSGRLEALSTWQGHTSRSHQATGVAAARQATELATVRTTVLELEQELCELHASKEIADQRASEAEAALAAAHQLMAEMAEPMFAPTLAGHRRAEVARLQEKVRALKESRRALRQELRDLRASRAIRWSAAPRAVLARTRRSAAE